MPTATRWSRSSRPTWSRRREWMTRPGPGRSPAARPRRAAAQSANAGSGPPWLRGALPLDLVLHDGGAPVDALLVERIAATGLVQAAAVVPDHDVAQPPPVLVLRRRLAHVGRGRPAQHQQIG